MTSSPTGPLRILTLATVLLAGSALGGSIFLNGVNIDGAGPVEIDRAKVHIDAKGDVHITAPGYQVQRPPTAPGEGSRVIGGPRPTRARYWLATELSTEARAGYDVDVLINGELAFRIREGDPQLSEEITKRLRAGRNTIRFEARKVGRTTPNRGSATPFLRIHLGEGVERSDRIVLDRPELTFTVTASEKDHRTQELVLEAQ
jgi:hypothetical protein